jgi:glycosyltransferase involved in cell wall biosynthesis
MVLGRLVPHKHFETAIDMVADLGDRFPGLTLDVVGGGYWDDELRAHAVSRGVADRVRFHGFVDEHTKRTLLARAWVVLLPSHKEGWGLTIVEAGLHGTPSVAFSFAGGVTESIVDDETGLLADDTGQMTAHVATLLSDERLREKYGDNARRHARSFSWESTTRQLEAALTRATGRR